MTSGLKTRSLPYLRAPPEKRPSAHELPLRRAPRQTLRPPPIVQGHLLRSRKGQKTAIVARNGTGKSTLLKCIAGLETPDEGIVTFNKGLRIGYLDQNVEMTASHSLVDEMLDRDDPVTNAIAHTNTPWRRISTAMRCIPPSSR